MVGISDPNVVQTEAMCICAVKENGYALRYVKKQTDAICLEAVKQHGFALDYVRHQTEAVCMFAVKNNGYALKYVQNQTEAICIEAVKENGFSLIHVKKKTDAICMEAVKQNGDALEYVRHQTEAICIEAVKNRPYALLRVINQTEIICLTAIKSFFGNRWHFTFEEIYNKIKYPSPQLITELLKLYPSYTDTIMSTYATNIMTTHKACSDAICARLVRHADDLLYRSNCVNALVMHTRWHMATSNAKTVFLMA